VRLKCQTSTEVNDISLSASRLSGFHDYKHLNTQHTHTRTERRRIEGKVRTVDRCSEIDRPIIIIMVVCISVGAYQLT